MTAPRIVTGNIAALTGDARAGIRATFTRTGAGDLFGQYGKAVVNEPVVAVSGVGGVLTVTLYPGNYELVAIGSNGPKRAPIALTEAGTVNLADLLQQASAVPITPELVAQTQNLRNEAVAAAAAADVDRVQTGLDRAATGSDRGQTGADRAATAADKVQTGLDRIATAADRVQTSIDRGSATADRAAIEAFRATVEFEIAAAVAEAMWAVQAYGDWLLSGVWRDDAPASGWLMTGGWDDAIPSAL